MPPGPAGVISEGLADRLDVLIPHDEPYEPRAADKDGKLRIIGQTLVKVVFQGAKVPGRAAFEAA